MSDHDDHDDNRGPPFVSPDDKFDFFKTTGLANEESHDEEYDDEFDLLQSLHGLSLPSATTTIRILAVADIDLPSAAALAEFALQEPIGGGNVDLCIACGPFCQYNDLIKGNYLQGSSSRQEQSRQGSSREETAALEGLMTGALSQLESIVCRVVFVPGHTDPVTTIENDDDSTKHIRLTANSHNLHKHWLQLAPGLGCTGLHHDTNDNDDEVLSTLTRLLDLAHPTTPPQQYSAPPPYPKPVKFASRISQAILLTHYCNTVDNNTLDDDDDPFDVYQEFLDSSSSSSSSSSSRAQNQVVLHVAYGKRPYTGKRGNVCTVIPGSLKESGDFCLIDVALESNQNNNNNNNVEKNAACGSKISSSLSTPRYASSSSSKPRPLYSWRVNRVQFRNMNRRL